MFGAALTQTFAPLSSSGTSIYRPVLALTASGFHRDSGTNPSSPSAAAGAAAPSVLQVPDPQLAPHTLASGWVEIPEGLKSAASPQI